MNGHQLCRMEGSFYRVVGTVTIGSYTEASTFAFPFLTYRERTLFDKNFHEVDLTKVDPVSIHSLYIPGNLGDSSYLMPKVEVMFWARDYKKSLLSQMNLNIKLKMIQMSA